MSENITTPAAATPDFVLFDDSTIAGFTGKKGYAPKFFAEMLPKFNDLVNLRTEYRTISGGVEAAQEAAIAGIVEGSPMWKTLNDCAEAEELAARLNAELKEWAAAQVAESSANPDEIKEKFAAIKSDFDKKVSGALDFFERGEEIVESESGEWTGDSEEGKLYVALMNAPKLGRGSGIKAAGKPGSQRGKLTREYVKANGITGPEGQELGTHGVIPAWAFEAYDARPKS